jgi:hypothetical protein
MDTLTPEAPANAPMVAHTAPAAPVAPVPAHAAKTGSTVKTDWAKYDGKDANKTMIKGLELCAVSIVATFIILGIYYLALKVLMRLFPAQAE